jgi:predicted MFS family arabinose efflux permease
MKNQPHLTKEERERYQRARVMFVLRLLFYVHIVAYVITNGFFLLVFGRVGL